METTNDNISRLLEMLDNPSAFTEQEIRDIINSDDEAREAYRLMVAAKQGYRHMQSNQAIDTEASWQRFEQEHMPRQRRFDWMKIAASFIGILLITGMAFAAVHILPPSKTHESNEAPSDSEQKMLTALHDGDAIVAIAVNVCKGTWIQNGDDSYIEEHPTFSFGFRLKRTTVKLDGMELDAHKLPNLPASALKKMEIGREDGRGFVNLITTPVQIPAGLKGNINPELTILLTGVVPQNATARSSIYVKRGLHEGFDWKEYQYTSWTGQAENVRRYLGEVAIRKDHHVRINICKGVSNKHIDRIKKIMEECNVTNYEIIQP